MGKRNTEQMPDFLIYEVGDDTDPDKQWVDKSDLLDEAMVIFKVEDTEGSEHFVLLDHHFVLFLFASFIQYDVTAMEAGRFDRWTLHHDDMSEVYSNLVAKYDEGEFNFESRKDFITQSFTVRDEVKFQLVNLYEWDDAHDDNADPFFCFNGPIELSHLIDDESYFAPFAFLALFLGKFATEDQRGDDEPFGLALRELSTSVNVCFNLNAAGPTPVAKLVEFLTTAAPKLPEPFYFVPNSFMEVRQLILGITRFHTGQENLAIKGLAHLLADEYPSFGNLLGDSPRYASVALTRLFEVVCPDKPVLLWVHTLTILKVIEEHEDDFADDKAADRVTHLIDRIRNEEDMLDRVKALPRSDGISNSDTQLSAKDVQKSVTNTRDFKSLAAAISNLTMDADYHQNVLQLSFAAKIPYVYQVLVGKEAVHKFHNDTLSTIAAATKEIGLFLTLQLNGDVPSNLFADGSLSNAVAVGFLCGTPGGKELPSSTVASKTFHNLLVGPMEDRRVQAHSASNYKYKAATLEECYSLATLQLFELRFAKLAAMVRVQAPDLTFVKNLYSGFEMKSSSHQRDILSQATRLMQALELEVAKTFNAVAEGDALHTAYPAHFTKTDGPVDQLQKSFTQATKYRFDLALAYGRDVFESSPSEKGNHKRKELHKPNNALTNAVSTVEPGSRKDLIKKDTATEFQFGVMMYQKSELREIYQKTAPAGATPFDEMCLPAGMCKAQGLGKLMACLHVGEPGHEGLTSKCHVFPTSFQAEAFKTGKKVGDAGGASSGGRSSRGGGRFGRGRGCGRGRANFH